MRASRLPAVKTLDQFDFAFQPSIKREQIESLHELGFLAAMGTEETQARSRARSRVPSLDQRPELGYVVARRHLPSIRAPCRSGQARAARAPQNSCTKRSSAKLRS